VISSIFYSGLYALSSYLFQHGYGGSSHFNYALALHIVAWISQFIGHGIYERKPALINSFDEVCACV
jgi:uncharacterized membrane protein YGL010W